MTFKNLSIKELQENCVGRHGFVFASAAASDQRNCEVIAGQVKDRGFTESMPEYCVSLNSDHWYVFVYPEGISFNGPAFMDEVQKFTMLGQFKIDLLQNFLNTVKEN